MSFCPRPARSVWVFVHGQQGAYEFLSTASKKNDFLSTASKERLSFCRRLARSVWVFVDGQQGAFEFLSTASKERMSFCPRPARSVLVFVHGQRASCPFCSTAIRDHRLPLWFAWILSSSGMLCSVGWFCTDVSGLRIGPIFKGEAVREDPWPLKMDRYVVPKRRW